MISSLLHSKTLCTAHFPLCNSIKHGTYTASYNGLRNGWKLLQKCTVQNILKPPKLTYGMVFEDFWSENNPLYGINILEKVLMFYHFKIMHLFSLSYKVQIMPLVIYSSHARKVICIHIHMKINLKIYRLPKGINF